jgi:hypothetical protein
MFISSTLNYNNDTTTQSYRLYAFQEVTRGVLTELLVWWGYWIDEWEKDTSEEEIED